MSIRGKTVVTWKGSASSSSSTTTPSTSTTPTVTPSPITQTGQNKVSGRGSVSGGGPPSLTSPNNNNNLPPLEEKKEVEKPVSLTDFKKNPIHLDGVPDMSALIYLEGPNILHNLDVRYKKSEIYTNIVRILLAVNPYQSVDIYSGSVIKAYRENAIERAKHKIHKNELPPHAFSVSQQALHNLTTYSECQSMIVCGESGSGKTETAKHLMRYLAYEEEGKDKKESKNSASIEKRVLEATPILESLGNAKTLLNNNSSRFGKFTKILFDTESNKGSAKIMGAFIETYLLEKSRVVYQDNGERNYHIFYQLCAGLDKLPKELTAELKIGRFDGKNRAAIGSPEDYYFLVQGQAPVIDGVNDASGFMEFVEALDILGLPKEEQAEVFRILAGILHLGNCEFIAAQAPQKTGGTVSAMLNKGGDDEASQITRGDSPETDSVAICAKLLGVDTDAMVKRLISRTINIRGQVIEKPFSKQDAFFNRDSIAKALYSYLFSWIVKRINLELFATEARKEGLKWIGILDVFGFESFEHNSFEQFCINYANERLQQYFNGYILRSEQDEYRNEAIMWTPISVPDNQDVLDLIDSKSFGLMTLLDSACKMPKGNDEYFTDSIFQRHKGHNRLKAVKSMKGKGGKGLIKINGFSLRHYAGEVVYDAADFLLKNADSTDPDTIALFNSSKGKIIKDMLVEPEDFDAAIEVGNKARQTNAPASKWAGKVQEKAQNVQQAQANNTQSTRLRSLGMFFASQLTMLMTTLQSTTPFFVRCIKPNLLKKPNMFNWQYVHPQLQCGGIIEALRILKCGFPTRCSYEKIFDRYGSILQPTPDYLNLRDFCEAVLTHCGPEDGKLEKTEYQLGLSKVFFRPGKQEFLETLLVQNKQLPPELVKKIRVFLFRKKFKRVKAGVIVHVGFALRLRQMRALRAIKRAMGIMNIFAKTMFKTMWRVRRRQSTNTFQAAITGYLEKKRITLQKKQSNRILSFFAHYHFRKRVLKELSKRIMTKKKKKSANAIAKFFKHNKQRKLLLKEIRIRVAKTREDRIKREREEADRLREEARLEKIRREKEKKYEEERKREEERKKIEDEKRAREQEEERKREEQRRLKEEEEERRRQERIRREEEDERKRIEDKRRREEEEELARQEKRRKDEEEVKRLLELKRLREEEEIKIVEEKRKRIEMEEQLIREKRERLEEEARKLEEGMKKKAEEDRIRREEEERKREEERARKEAEKEEKRRKRAEEKRLKEEEERKREEERRKKEEEDRRRREEEDRERKAREEEDRKREEERRKRDEEERRKREEEDRRRDEERRKRDEEEERKREEKRKREEEEERRREERRRKEEEEEFKRKLREEEEEFKRKLQEEKNKRDEEEKKKEEERLKKEAEKEERRKKKLEEKRLREEEEERKKEERRLRELEEERKKEERRRKEEEEERRREEKRKQEDEEERRRKEEKRKKEEEEEERRRAEKRQREEEEDRRREEERKRREEEDKRREEERRKREEEDERRREERRKREEEEEKRYKEEKRKKEEEEEKRREEEKQRKAEEREERRRRREEEKKRKLEEELEEKKRKEKGEHEEEEAEHKVEEKQHKLAERLLEMEKKKIEDEKKKLEQQLLAMQAQLQSQMLAQQQREQELKEKMDREDRLAAQTMTKQQLADRELQKDKDRASQVRFSHDSNCECNQCKPDYKEADTLADGLTKGAPFTSDEYPYLKLWVNCSLDGLLKWYFVQSQEDINQDTVPLGGVNLCDIISVTPLETEEDDEDEENNSKNKNKKEYKDMTEEEKAEEDLKKNMDEKDLEALANFKYAIQLHIDGQREDDGMYKSKGKKKTKKKKVGVLGKGESVLVLKIDSEDKRDEWITMLKYGMRNCKEAGIITRPLGDPMRGNKWLVAMMERVDDLVKENRKLKESGPPKSLNTTNNAPLIPMGSPTVSPSSSTGSITPMAISPTTTPTAAAAPPQPTPQIIVMPSGKIKAPGSASPSISGIKPPESKTPTSGLKAPSISKLVSPTTTTVTVSSKLAPPQTQTTTTTQSKLVAPTASSSKLKSPVPVPVTTTHTVTATATVTSTTSKTGLPAPKFKSNLDVVSLLQSQLAAISSSKDDDTSSVTSDSSGGRGSVSSRGSISSGGRPASGSITNGLKQPSKLAAPSVSSPKLMPTPKAVSKLPAPKTSGLPAPKVVTTKIAAPKKK